MKDDRNMSREFIRKHTCRITLGCTFGERLNRAMTHFLMCFIDKKVNWHLRGILREII